MSRGLTNSEAQELRDALADVGAGSFIKSADITATTTAYGNIDLGVTLSDVYILFAYIRTTNGIATTYLQPTADWYVRCTTNSDGAAIASRSVTVRYYYIER